MILGNTSLFELPVDSNHRPRGSHKPRRPGRRRTAAAPPAAATTEVSSRSCKTEGRVTEFKLLRCDVREVEVQ